jgi:hypothetical protein
MKEKIVILIFIAILLILALYQINKIDDAKMMMKELLTLEELSEEGQFALKTWSDIFLCQPELHSTEGRIRAEKEIFLLVDVLAAKIKNSRGFSGDIINVEDLEEALYFLNRVSPIMADVMVGNRDGICTAYEMSDFINKPETSFQVGVVMKMIREIYYKDNPLAALPSGDFN